MRRHCTNQRARVRLVHDVGKATFAQEVLLGRLLHKWLDVGIVRRHVRREGKSLLQ